MLRYSLAYPDIYTNQISPNFQTSFPFRYSEIYMKQLSLSSTHRFLPLCSKLVIWS